MDVPDTRRVPDRELFRLHPRLAWERFLIEWAELLFKVASYRERDTDLASDCFVYICEQLVANDFRRLLRFRADGTASLSTWLTVVAGNLAVDWSRKHRGRDHEFEFVKQLSAKDRKIFEMIYKQRRTVAEVQEA